MDDDFIHQLTAMVSSGLRGDVGVIPRQFLRELVNIMDLVEENDGSDGAPGYVPKAAYSFTAGGLSSDEERLIAGEAGDAGGSGGPAGYKVENLTW